MRAALALYALRFGGWLLSKASGSMVGVTVELWHASDPDGETLELSRVYEP